MVKIYSMYLLGFICIMGILYGLRQFLHPEKTVEKRYQKHHKLAVETGDKEFQHWLKNEFSTQVKKNQKSRIITGIL